MAELGLEEIPEDSATGRVSEIYADIRAVMRTTHVGYFFRALAVHETYFEAAWAALRPNAAISYFDRVADGVRMRTIPPMPEDVPDLEEELEDAGYSRDQIETIDGLFDLYNDESPKTLMLAAALKGTLNGLKIGGIAPGFARDLEARPQGPPASMRVPALDPTGDGAAAGLASIRREMGFAGLPDIWRALAAYPECLERAWAFVREEWGKKGFEITVRLAQGAAAAAAQEFPHPVEASQAALRGAGCSDDELNVIEKKIDQFIHMVPVTNVAIILMKAALVGEGRVRRKPFEGE
ncbi:MAG: hypothetical protein O2807_11010 [bacterium]|nr:hypothetical protein [bacterium]